MARPSLDKILWRQSSFSSIDAAAPHSRAKRAFEGGIKLIINVTNDKLCEVECQSRRNAPSCVRSRRRWSLGVHDGLGLRTPWPYRAHERQPWNRRPSDANHAHVRAGGRGEEHALAD